jgi:chemotaxis protein methyltransferase CheR
MIGDNRPISLKVVAQEGHATSRQAESLGLMVTELVMNAVKHAFPNEKVEGHITVAYEVAGTNWKLSVADNGVGKPGGRFCLGKNWAWHGHCQGDRATTRGLCRNFGRP